MYKAIYLSPMVSSSNVRETARFFTELFQFEISLESEGYIIVSRDNLTLHLSQASNDVSLSEFYLEVDALDELWNSIKDKLKGLKLREPFNQAYGMREFHIEPPCTKTIMFVGQEIK